MNRTTVIAAAILASALTAGNVEAQQAPAQGQPPIKIVTFRLQRNRLEPSQLTIPEGRYSVNLVNGYVLGDLDFTWLDGGGSQRAAAKLKKGSARSRMFVQLTVGKYVLHVVGKPEWKCDVTVIKKN